VCVRALANVCVEVFLIDLLRFPSPPCSRCTITLHNFSLLQVVFCDPEDGKNLQGNVARLHIGTC
jgi:hypothetical protein